MFLNNLVQSKTSLTKSHCNEPTGHKSVAQPLGAETQDDKSEDEAIQAIDWDTFSKSASPPGKKEGGREAGREGGGKKGRKGEKEVQREGGEQMNLTYKKT